MLDKYKESPGNLPYVLAVMFMSLLGVIGLISITVLRPDKDNTTLIATVLGFLAPTTVAILTLMKSQETKLLVNGRLDTMIEAAKTAAFHAGAANERSTMQATATVEARGVLERKIDEAQVSIEKKIDDKTL